MDTLSAAESLEGRQLLAARVLVSPPGRVCPDNVSAAVYGPTAPKAPATPTSSSSLTDSVAAFVVSTLADNGPGSLRQAMLNANAAISPATIRFDVTGTIVVGTTPPSPTRSPLSGRSPRAVQPPPPSPSILRKPPALSSPPGPTVPPSAPSPSSMPAALESGSLRQMSPLQAASSALRQMGSRFRGTRVMASTLRHRHETTSLAVWPQQTPSRFPT